MAAPRTPQKSGKAKDAPQGAKGTSRKSSAGGGVRLRAEARMALLHLELTNADADAAGWERLREQMLADAARHGATGAHRELLTAEFDTVRDRALGKRWLRLAASALREGTLTVHPVGTQAEEWELHLADGSAATVLAPVHDDDPLSAANLARRALRGPRCPACHRGLVDVGAGEVGIDHKRRCAAAGLSA